MSHAVIPEERTTVPATAGRLPAPYQAAQEHVADLLVRHDWLLKREIARSQVHKPVDVLGFAAITEQEVQRLLGEASGGKTPASAELKAIEAALQGVEHRIALRVAESQAHGVRLPLIELATRFRLTDREVDILFACLAVELDRRYARIHGYLHDDMSRRLPSPGLVLGLYCNSSAEQLSLRALLSPLAPLRRHRLVDLLEDGSATPWISRPMCIDERIVSFLLGDDAIDSRIARQGARLEPMADSVDIGTHQRDTLAALLRHVRHWTVAALVRKKPLIYMHGARNAGADVLARAAARQLGVPLLSLDAELLVETGSEFEQLFPLLFREGLLSQAAIYLGHIDRLLEPAAGAMRYRALLDGLVEMGSIVFASGEHPWCWPMPADPVVLHAVELRVAGIAEQLQAWQALSREQIPAAHLHRLVSLHPLPPGAINDAWRMAQGLAAAAGTHGVPRLEHLHQACRAQAGVPVNALARRIEPTHDWSDLVLPAAQQEQLSAICSQARHSSVVYGAWGFERKLSLGRALNALFSGPPGTGKTMAAEVIAAELGVDLLKIDLSQIVSKYIGDTEKNLRQLFDQAAGANAILFFDEADALLGKRSEVKNAHDRHANTETAYLLQKMEEYAGITILATNLRQNMDEAFMRRMRFIVEFPFPDDADRLRIWQTAWPPEVPLAPDVDLPSLARQFRLSGGNIRNVALSAAFLAAEQGQPVSMRHLMQSAKRELQKMGRLVNELEYAAMADARGTPTGLAGRPGEQP